VTHPPDPSDPLLGKTIGPYRFESFLEVETTCTVYSAVHLQLQEPVAIKVLRAELAESSESVQQFNGQARAMARRRDPNGPFIIDVGTLPDGRPFMVTSRPR